MTGPARRLADPGGSGHRSTDRTGRYGDRVIDRPATSTPAGPPPPTDVAELRRECERLRRELERTRELQAAAQDSAVHWRAQALRSWVDAGSGTTDRRELLQARERAEHLAEELDRTRSTLSWRVTAPLRRVRRLRPTPPAA